MIHCNLDVCEALWNFNRLEDNRRITLQQNPYFYKKLPTSSDARRGSFEVHPIEGFGNVKPNETIYVLVDGPSRVFLETEQRTRIFVNVFELKDVMVFKGCVMFLPFLTPFRHLIRYLRSTPRRNDRKIYPRHV
jgi:hypothetical protein